MVQHDRIRRSSRMRFHWLICASIAALAIGLSAWWLARPKIRTATIGEVESLLPRELLVESAPDPVAESRLLDLYAAVRHFETKDFALPELVSSRQGTPMQVVLLVGADKVWHDGRYDKVQRVLHTGPLALPNLQSLGPNRTIWRQANSTELYSKVRLIAKGLANSEIIYQENGDRKNALFCILSMIELSDRMMALNGGILSYLVAASLEMSASGMVANYARDRLTPANDCRTLLDSLSAPPDVDQLLAISFRTQLQKEILPKLPDPFREVTDNPGDQNSNRAQLEAREGSLKSNYDALATTELVGQVYAAEIGNALRPYIFYNTRAEEIQRRARNRLAMPPRLEDADQFSKRLESFKYRLATTSTDNYFGRSIIAWDFGDRRIINRSDLWRAMRNAVRVLLASRIYRESHGGKLPNESSELLPYLKVWPMDPYDGKPMRYNPVKGVVYSVGSNLVDDGGNIKGPTTESPDVGLSLAYDRWKESP